MKAQEALATAQQTALAREHTVLSPLHLLHALLSDDKGVATAILRKIGTDVPRVRSMVESELGRLPVGKTDQIAPEDSLRKVILSAHNQAEKLGDTYVSVDHFLLALAEVKSDAKEVLSVNSITPEAIGAALKDVRGGERVTSDNPEAAYQALERFGIDMVPLARQGKLDPVIGRGQQAASQGRGKTTRRVTGTGPGLDRGMGAGKGRRGQD